MALLRSPRQRLCSRCERYPAVDGGLCWMDIRILAKKVAAAYDAIRKSNAGAQGDTLLTIVREYIDIGHEGHVYVPRPGCPWCRERLNP